MSTETERQERVFRVGGWSVHPGENSLRQNGNRYRVEPRSMDLLILLARNAGRTVSKEEIFRQVWSETFVTDSSLWRCVSDLRQILEEDPANPKLIVTVPRRGYRLEGTVEPAATASQSEQTPWQPPRASGLPAGLAVLGLSVLLVLAWVWSPFIDSGNSGFDADGQKRPNLLLVPFHNQTGNELLDGTLEVVLEARLNDSGRLQLVLPDRVESAFRLMREPVETPLTEKLALKVSQRDGLIDYLVTGRIDRLGERFHVMLKLLDGHSRKLIESNALVTDSLEGLLPLADDQSSWLLDRLQINTPTPAERPERVTTRSLEALKLYTRGVEEYSSRFPSGRIARQNAARLFEEATRIDPEFASAHLMLAWSLQTGEKSWEAIEKAMTSRANASLVERLFIQGSYYHWKRENQAAVPYYRQIIEIQPGHRWAANNLAVMAARLDDKDLWLEAQMSRLRRPLHQQHFTLITLARNGDLDAAQTFRNGVVKLLKRYKQPVLEKEVNRILDRRHQAAAYLRGFDIWSEWAQGNYRAVENSVTEWSREVAQLRAAGVDVANVGYAHWLGTLQVLLGRLKDARVTERTYQLEPEHGNRSFRLVHPGVLLAFLEESAVPLGPPISNSQAWPAYQEFVLARMLFDEHFIARDPLGDLPKFNADSFRLFVSYYHPRDLDARIERLQAHLSGRSNANPGALVTQPWVLSRDLAHQGRREEALGVLEAIVARKQRAVGRIAPIIWQKAALDLARAYQQQGRHSEAEPLLEDLREMLQFADPGHPILRALDGDLLQPKLTARAQ